MVCCTIPRSTELIYAARYSARMKIVGANTTDRGLFNPPSGHSCKGFSNTTCDRDRAMKPHGDVRAGFRRGIYTRVLRARMGLLSKGKQQSYSAAKPAACLAEEDELEDELPQNSSGSAAPKAQKVPILSGFLAGGAEGGRTPDLLIANEALSQLSYGPA